LTALLAPGVPIAEARPRHSGWPSRLAEFIVRARDSWTITLEAETLSFVGREEVNDGIAA